MKLPSNLLPETVEYIKKVNDTLSENKKEVDDAALTMLAIDYDIIMRSYKEMTDNNVQILASSGYANQYLGVIQRFQNVTIRIMKEFGLTVKSRDGIKLFSQEDDDEDPLANFK